MNKQAIFSILLVTLIGIFGTACSKEDNNSKTNPATTVSGTYKGSISYSENPAVKTDATFDISRVDPATIHLHLMSEMMDTTFMLNLYENADSIMVCFNGEDFYSHYGHHLDEGHHMMNGNGYMDWSHHMNEQHQPGDEHFGGFDMNHHSFSYRIIPSGQSDAYYQFEGIKE